MSDNKVINVDFLKNPSKADEKLFEFEIELTSAIQKAHDNGVWPALIIAVLQIHLTRETNDMIEAMDNVFDEDED